MITKEQALSSVDNLYDGYGDDLYLSKLNLKEYIEQQEYKETLRDKFAMAALTGLLFQYSTKYPHEDAIKESYQIADTMMKRGNNMMVIQESNS